MSLPRRTLAANPSQKAAATVGLSRSWHDESSAALIFISDTGQGNSCVHARMLYTVRTYTYYVYIYMYTQTRSFHFHTSSALLWLLCLSTPGSLHGRLPQHRRHSSACGSTRPLVPRRLQTLLQDSVSPLAAGWQPPLSFFLLK